MKQLTKIIAGDGHFRCLPSTKAMTVDIVSNSVLAKILQKYSAMKGLDQYLVPYLLSQVVAFGILLAALTHTRLARLLFSLLFLYAAVFNMQLSLRDPDAYLDYASMALPFYRNFIQGTFSQIHYIMVPAIALGQLLIGIGMLLKGAWVRWACIGAIAFLLAIAPLMVGSAFPFSLIVSIAAWRILQRDKKAYLWHKPISTSLANE